MEASKHRMRALFSVVQKLMHICNIGYKHQQPNQPQGCPTLAQLAIEVMKNQSKIMILCLPRTGSSTLNKAVEQHPDIQSLGEPFHPNKAGAGYGSAHDAASFTSTVNAIFEDYNCIKHMMEHVPVEYHADVLKRNDLRIIFLYRKNLLRKVISQMISRQTKLWAQGGEARSQVMKHVFDPVPVERVRRLMNRAMAKADEFRVQLDGMGIDYFDLAYEDLYENQKSLAERLRVFEQIISFTGYDLEPLMQEPMSSAVATLLAPGEKLNSHDSYRLIPNIDEIEAQCGAKETGYLFR